MLDVSLLVSQADIQGQPSDAEQVYYLSMDLFGFEALSDRNKAALLW